MFDTKSMGVIQKAGCPLHTKNYGKLVRAIISANKEVALGIMKNNDGIKTEVQSIFSKRVNEKRGRR